MGPVEVLWDGVPPSGGGQTENNASHCTTYEGGKNYLNYPER